jgi:hypothetical protein
MGREGYEEITARDVRSGAKNRVQAIPFFILLITVISK